MENARDVFSAAVVIIVLLLLTPWPTAMMVVSAIGLVAGLVLWRRRATLRSKLLTSMVAFAVAAAIAIVLSLSRSH
jgi:hypothetical protein